VTAIIRYLPLREPLHGYAAIGTYGDPPSEEHVILGEPVPGVLSAVPGGLLFTPDGDQHRLWAEMEDRVYQGLYAGFWMDDWTWMVWTPLWLGSDQSVVGQRGNTVSVELDDLQGGRTWSFS
jgi:hypothetical protein